MIGETISHYKVLEKIGEGGMNIVYKAEDTTLKRHVALKFPSAQLLADKAKKARFIHEARAVAALGHSNKGIAASHIVRVNRRKGLVLLLSKC